MSPELPLRDARDDDADDLIALIGDTFAEYPGCVLDVDGELPELRAIATAFRRWNGRFWVLEAQDRVVACVGYTPACEPGGLELRKLYVAARSRRRGLGAALCNRVEVAAAALGAHFVELWTDTRFATAHRLYERLGYARGAATRALHDKSATVEYYYRKSLTRAVADPHGR